MLLVLLVGGLFLLGREPPFLRVYDNRRASWCEVESFSGRVLMLLDGRRLRVVAVPDPGVFPVDDADVPLEWVMDFGNVCADAVPGAAPGEQDVTLWSTWTTCDNGLAVWNPLSRDVPLTTRQVQLTAVLAGNAPTAGD